MKQKLLLLLTALMLLTTGNAWGETIGATNKGWGDKGSYKSYLLSANKTLTLTFTLTDYVGEWAGYVVNLTKTDVPAFGGDNGYVWFRGVDFGWYKTGWSTGAIVSNTNTIGSMLKSDWQAFVKDATTVMEIKRLCTQVFINTKVTKAETSYSHYFVQEIGTTKDIYAFLCADAAVIDITSDVTTDTNASSIESTTATHTNVGFNAAGFCTLSPNEEINIHFTNTTSGTNTWNSWGLELFWDNKYFDLVAGNHNIWGELWGDYSGDPAAWHQNAVKGEFSDINWPSTDDEVKSKLAGADVTLTIARSGRVVTITALHTPTSGDPFVMKYTFEPRASYTDFGTQDIQVNLLVDNSTVTLNYPITKVNAEVTKYGWGTFSSNYKLDFTGVSGLEAYAVTGNKGNVIEKSDALGVVAANSGVLLKGTTGTTSTFYNIPVSTGAAYDGTNLMVAGTGESVSAEGGKTKYVLGVNGSEKAEFQKIAGTAATVATGKAYLQFNEVISGARTVLNIEDDFTGINAIEAEEAEAEGGLKDGKYIIDNKIVLVKNGVKYGANGQKLN